MLLSNMYQETNMAMKLHIYAIYLTYKYGGCIYIIYTTHEVTDINHEQGALYTH